MRKSKKMVLSDLSRDSQRKKRAAIVRKSTKNEEFDRDKYNKEYQKKLKNVQNFWEGWFKMEYANND